MALHLRVEPPQGAHEERLVDATEMVVGRLGNAGLVLPDPSVSRQHALLKFQDGGWWVEALSSTNPTHLNRVQLAKPARIFPGDLLQMGSTVVRILQPPTQPQPASGVHDRQAARLNILNEVHRALATAISLPQLLDLILERCFDVLGPEEGVILLRKPDGTLERAATCQRAGGKGDVFVSRRLIDEVAGKGKPALVMDAAVDERLMGSESIVMSGVRSVVAAPLVDGEAALGLIVLSSRAGVRQFTEQDLDLLVSLASAAALRVRNVALAEEAAQRRVLERELSIAHDIQMSMLPRPLPDRPEVSIAGSLKPARSVGGDLYDFWIDGDRLWFIVADVAGKGVGAALYMAVVKALFRASAHGDISVAEVAGRLNSEIARDNDSMLFVTAMFGTLRLSAGDVVIVDAGHNPAAIAGPDGALYEPPIPKSIALGVLEDAVFTEGHIPLPAGATLVLYTDGATDARSRSGEMFGATRLNATIAGGAQAHPRPADLVTSITATIESFATGAAPEDDITLLAIRTAPATGH